MKYFLYIGILATIVDFSLYSILIYLELASYELAIIFGYTTGFLISFFLTRRYAFKSIRIKTPHYELMAVIFVTILGLLLNLGIVNILIKFNVSGYIARIISIGVVFFFNYFVRKKFIYA
jgi:putative flippase GtrA